ncbi:CDP-alcohol phosphatidyltransferase family protein [Blastococcus sp. KM273129]|uniref:CDP-alcohol phosphatidyltransferase family protein n=1 Tax=Blastococcus sp. KM273129 TaxID=2570315 RepID=UPI001F02D15C|nr:CDP-alcohol phosphatidyltransferase family protein [Blastococcus sp. KM273129]MCF6735475.1 CDP-alcohol phosphatidyltransferase family protein [Blastococcus sp. KM273129]
MRVARLETALGALGTAALLGVLSLAVGLDAAGWSVGLVSGWAATALLVVGRARRGDPVLPPDRVTLGRAVLTAGVAALVAGSADRPLPVTAVVVLSSVALVLDNVDGRVARRTGTATPFGARLDGEVDAFLILVLSIAVARDHGAWVLAIGAARYVFLGAGWVLPWLAAPLPPRYWGKVVAAASGVVLTVAVSGVLPHPVGTVAVGVVLLLLAESFGRSVVWLYRTGAGPRTRRALRSTTAVVAAGVVWAVLVAPPRLDQLTPGSFARIPLEGLALVALGLVLPPRPRRVVATAAGVALAVLAVVKLLDTGFTAQIGRPFNPVLDHGAFVPAVEVVQDSVGEAATLVVLGLAALALVLAIALVVASTIRLTGGAARHRGRSARGLAALGLVWAVCAALSLQLTPAGPVASTSAAGLALAHGRDVGRALADQERFDTEVRSADPRTGAASGPGLLAALRGKDVVIAFVESYGRVAVEDPVVAPGVTSVLRTGTTRLERAGFEARSAFLDSPTYGGYSWLAHATLQSGLWIDGQPRYDRLMASDRRTLSSAFGAAGWRTVGVNPAHDGPWPEGTSFYGYDRVYDRNGLGYRGPAFSWARVPDQYTLAAFERLELRPGHAPVMAQIDLVSSHQPWTPLPAMVPWDELGDGSVVFEGMVAQGLSPEEAWRDPETVRRLYAQSIQYSLEALISWVARLDDPDLVLVVVGDHQPPTAISAPDAGREVLVSLVTSDPAVLEGISAWDWQTGLLPGPTAPVWPMDAFRDRFLDAFGAAPGVRAEGPVR